MNVYETDESSVTPILRALCEGFFVAESPPSWENRCILYSTCHPHLWELYSPTITKQKVAYNSHKSPADLNSVIQMKGLQLSSVLAAVSAAHFEIIPKLIISVFAFYIFIYFASIKGWPRGILCMRLVLLFLFYPPPPPLLTNTILWSPFFFGAIFKAEYEVEPLKKI